MMGQGSSDEAVKIVTLDTQWWEILQAIWLVTEAMQKFLYQEGNQGSTLARAECACFSGPTAADTASCLSPNTTQFPVPCSRARCPDGWSFKSHPNHPSPSPMCSLLFTISRPSAPTPEASRHQLGVFAREMYPNGLATHRPHYRLGLGEEMDANLSAFQV